MKHQDKIKFIRNRIQKSKSGSVESRSHKRGDVVYYEGYDDEILMSVVMVDCQPGKVLYLEDGNWCYGWQAVNENELPESVRL